MLWKIQEEAKLEILEVEESSSEAETKITLQEVRENLKQVNPTQS